MTVNEVQRRAVEQFVNGAVADLHSGQLTGESSVGQVSSREIALLIRSARDGSNGVPQMTTDQVREVLAGLTGRPGMADIVTRFNTMAGLMANLSQPAAAAQPAQPAQPARPTTPTESPQRAATALPAADTQPPQIYTRSAVTPRTLPQSITHLLETAEHFNANAWNSAHPNQFIEVGGRELRGAEMRDFVTGHLRAAQTAAASGDYATAERELSALGLPYANDGSTVTPEQQVLATVMGATSPAPGGGVSIASNRHPLTTLQGFHEHARLMNDMSRMGVTPLADPPTLDQGRQYVDHVRRANPNDPQPVADAAQRFAQGTTVHYRRHQMPNVGGHDIDYGANTTRYSLRDAHGQALRDNNGEPRMFNSADEARRYATANHLSGVTPYGAQVHTPNSEADVTTNQAEVGLRREGDCESFAYIYSQVLGTQPGWENVGSIDVEPQNADGSPRRPPHNIGHMFQIIRAPGGQTYLTSNDHIIPVRGTGANGAVTHSDIMAAANTEGYHIYTANPQPDRLGMFVDTSSTDAVETIRRSAERRVIRDDTVRFSTQPAVRPPPAAPLEAAALANAGTTLALAWGGENGAPHARLWLAGHGTPPMIMVNPLTAEGQAARTQLRAAHTALQQAMAEAPPNPNALRDARVAFQAAALSFAQVGMRRNPPATGTIDAATAQTWLQSIATPPPQS